MHYIIGMSALSEYWNITLTAKMDYNNGRYIIGDADFK